MKRIIASIFIGIALFVTIVLVGNFARLNPLDVEGTIYKIFPAQNGMFEICIEPYDSSPDNPQWQRHCGMVDKEIGEDIHLGASWPLKGAK